MLAPISSARAASRLLLRRASRGLAASGSASPVRVFRANKSTLSVAIRGSGSGLAQSVTTAG